MQWQQYLEKRTPQATGEEKPERIAPERMAAEIEKLAAEIRGTPVPGGWDVFRHGHPVEWRRLTAACDAVDSAFIRQDVLEVGRAIASVRQVVSGICRTPGKEGG